MIGKTIHGWKNVDNSSEKDDITSQGTASVITPSSCYSQGKNGMVADFNGELGGDGRLPNLTNFAINDDRGGHLSPSLAVQRTLDLGGGNFDGAKLANVPLSSRNLTMMGDSSKGYYDREDKDSLLGGSSHHLD